MCKPFRGVLSAKNGGVLVMRTSSSEINLLFTSVGRRVQLLRAFRRAYEGLGLAGRIIGADMNRLAPALGVVDRPYVVPSASEPEFAAVLAEICRRERATLVFPLIDPDIPILAREQETIKRLARGPLCYPTRRRGRPRTNG